MSTNALARLLSFALAVALLCQSAPAKADAITKHHKRYYWQGHSAALGGFLLAGAVLGSVAEVPPPRQYPEPRLWSLSNAFYTLDLALPVPAIATGHDGTNFGRGIFIYTETLAAGYVVNGLMRLTCRGGTRAAPALAAAVVASHLFGETHSTPNSFKASFWSVEMALATSSSILRFQGTLPERRSGWLLAAEGLSGIGLGMLGFGVSGGNIRPLARKSGQGIGALIGLAVGQLAWFVPIDDPVAAPVIASLELAPFAGDAPGLSVSGQW